MDALEATFAFVFIIFMLCVILFLLGVAAYIGFVTAEEIYDWFMYRKGRK